MNIEKQQHRAPKRISYFVLLVVLLASIFITSAVSAADKVEDKKVLTRESFEVTSLPGLTTRPDFKHYAGYLDVDKTYQNKLFFWLFESQSSPVDDPLLIWLSGGPGCSSISAMFDENGPFKLKRNGEAIQVVKNKYSWNSKANIVYIDQPIGTGLSYSETRTYTRNQYQANEQFYEFLRKFYKVFPEYQKRPLFITGESYAGHMIPAIATYIYEQEGKPNSVPVNLKGIAIGNGWVDPITHSEVFADVLYAAGTIDENERDETNRMFDMSVKYGGTPKVENFAQPGSREGVTAPVFAPIEPYEGLILPPALRNNPYAISLKFVLDQYIGKKIAIVFSVKDFIQVIDIIGKGPNGLRELLPSALQVLIRDKSYPALVFQNTMGRAVSYTEHNGNYVNSYYILNYGPASLQGFPTAWPEGDGIFGEYMNYTEGVREAIHAESFPDQTMLPCNPLIIYFAYYEFGTFYKSALYLYPNLLNKIPILFYNGQDDLVCNPMGTLKFLKKLSRAPFAFYFPGKERFDNAPYVPWSIKKNKKDDKGNDVIMEKRFGYYKQAGHLHFLNVLGASHMVPMSKPEAAQIMINDFIHKGKIITD